MESLSETTWDVVLSGTGLPQSLLALALSRSGKKVLHIDKNDYYGGAEAALSLQEAETWAESAQGGAGPSPFRNATIRNLQREAPAQPKDVKQSELGFSRAYSLSLSPQLIYTRSNLLPALVSSKVYRQLEFLAVGSWWLYNDDEKDGTNKKDVEGAAATPLTQSLRRIPGGREDVFTDNSIDRRSSMSLIRFLKLAADPEAHTLVLHEWGQKSFPDFLESQLKIPPRLHAPLIALTLSPNTPAETLTSYALPRIHRHLTSIGMFGPGFGSVIPKWGGLAEVAQVACRAGAVGGGVYVLKNGFKADNQTGQGAHGRQGNGSDEETQLSTVRLEGDEDVKTWWIVSELWDLPPRIQDKPNEDIIAPYVARSISIVSGSLPQLFPPPVEGAPPPAGAVIVFPTGSISVDSTDQTLSTIKSELPPLYLMVHSSDIGECPAGQCIIYGQTSKSVDSDAHLLLQIAVERLLTSIIENPPPKILWYMHYDQKCSLSPTSDDRQANTQCDDSSNPHVLQLPDLAPGFVLEDDVLKHVKAAYQKIMGDEGAPFMLFDDREGQGEGEDEGDEGDA